MKVIHLLHQLIGILLEKEAHGMEEWVMIMVTGRYLPLPELIPQSQ
jgi:hypothetical protein